jgi:hypothetical protein
MSDAIEAAVDAVRKAVRDCAVYVPVGAFMDERLPSVDSVALQVGNALRAALTACEAAKGGMGWPVEPVRGDDGGAVYKAAPAAKELIARLQGLSRWLDAAAYRDAPSGELRMAVTEAADALSSLVRERDEARRTLNNALAVGFHMYVPSAMHMGDCDICGNVGDAPQHIDWKARATAAEANAARMREALKPFAEYMSVGMDLDNHGNPIPDTEGVGWVYLTHGDFRRARKALGGKDE